MIFKMEMPILVNQSGFMSKLVMDVTPGDKDNPIRTLIFNGISPVKAGDYISAQIPRYKEEKVNSGFYSSPFEKERVFYFDRKFNPEEIAIELTLLSENGDIIRIDRAVNYNKFVNRGL